MRGRYQGEALDLRGHQLLPLLAPAAGFPNVRLFDIKIKTIVAFVVGEVFVRRFLS